MRSKSFTYFEQQPATYY